MESFIGSGTYRAMRLSGRNLILWSKRNLDVGTGVTVDQSLIILSPKGHTIIQTTSHTAMPALPSQDFNDLTCRRRPTRACMPNCCASHILHMYCMHLFNWTGHHWTLNKRRLEEAKIMQSEEIYPCEIWNDDKGSRAQVRFNGLVKIANWSQMTLQASRDLKEEALEM